MMPIELELLITSQHFSKKLFPYPVIIGEALFNYLHYIKCVLSSST